MGKHTEGPFYLGIGEQYCFHDGNRVAICKMNNPGEDDETEETVAEVWPTDGDQDIADGHLFAAAPDLLEALKAIAECHDGRCDSCGCIIAPEGYCGCDPNDVERTEYDRRCTARIAIAKAEGTA